MNAESFTDMWGTGATVMSHSCVGPQRLDGAEFILPPAISDAQSMMDATMLSAATAAGMNSKTALIGIATLHAAQAEGPHEGVVEATQGMGGTVVPTSHNTSSLATDGKVFGHDIGHEKG